MSGGRKVTAAWDARAFLKTVRSAGVPRVEWAGAHRLDGCSLHARALNPSRRGAVAETQRLFELVPRACLAPCDAVPGARWDLRDGGRRGLR